VDDPISHSLSDNQLFRGLPERIIDRLAAVAVRRECRRDERIFSQGDDGDALYCVVSGQVRIDTVGLGGQEVFLNLMYPGDCFGEIAVVDGLPRTAGACATEPTVLLAVRRSDFLRLLSEESTLAIHLLVLFCERLRWTTNLYEDSAFLTSPERLAKRVLSLAMLHGRQVNGGMELKISQSDLARFLGVSRQIVNRHLHDWKDRGWVEIARARLLIQDSEALRRLAAGLRDAH
jgi:CRP/FNR family cyclic AMP-dependent transcriptional regulator